MWIRKDPASRWLAVWNWRSICATGRRCASDTAARRRPAPIRPSALTRKSSPSVRWIAPPSNAVARSASPSTLMIAVSMTTRSAPNSMTILLVRSIAPPPPSLPPSLPPSRKSILNEYDLISVDSLPRKKIPEPKSSNGNSNGPIKSEALKKSSARSSMTRSEILLVDMNGSCPSPKRNGLSDAAATPQSTEQAHSKNSTEKVKEAAASRPSTPTVTNGQSRPQSPKIEPAAVQLVKRLSRDVINHYNTITKPNQEWTTLYSDRNWSDWCWSRCVLPSAKGVSPVLWRGNSILPISSWNDTNGEQKRSTNRYTANSNISKQSQAIPERILSSKRDIVLEDSETDSKENHQINCRGGNPVPPRDKFHKEVEELERKNFPSSYWKNYWPEDVSATLTGNFQKHRLKTSALRIAQIKRWIP